MTETRKLAAILVSDVVGYSRLAGTNEELTLARLRALRSDLIDPIIAVHRGRIVKRTGDGAIVDFRGVVDAVRCAIEVQNGIVERNAGAPPEKRIEFRIGVHLGDVMEESDGDLMGDGVNIAARLEGICPPNGVCLSEDAYRQVKSRLDLTVTDLGEQSLKNIAEPVRAYALEVGLPARAKPAPTSSGTSQNQSVTPAKAGVHGTTATLGGRVDTGLRRYGAVLVVGVIALIVLASGAAWYFIGSQKTVPVQTAAAPVEPAKVATPAGVEAAHLSIVVLPFTNLSGDASQDYFADGITENLTTDLSRIRNSFVIARNTAFTFKGKNIDAKEIGKELGVRYVLEGSVQRDGNRVRVNAQLIDAETGAHLWAYRFEDDLADLFKLQDDVVARLANTVGYELVNAEAQKASHSTNPDAIDLTMRGWAIGNLHSGNKETRKQARDFFDQALKLDPADDGALAGLAADQLGNFAYGWGPPDTDYDKTVLPLADQAIALNPHNVAAYVAKSTYYFLSRRGAEAFDTADTGLAANPNAAELYFARAGAENSLGRFDQAKADMLQAIRLSPRDPISVAGICSSANRRWA
jgi:adenylate cyclase